MHDRRGVVNLMDAVVFIIILTMLAAMIVNVGERSKEQLDLDRLHDILLGTEIRLDRVSPGAYGVLPLHAVLLLSASDPGVASLAEKLCIDILEGITPPGHRLQWSLEADGHIHECGEGGAWSQVSVRDVLSPSAGIVRSSLKLV